jgi:DNA-3-methyladenine glycosylase I
LFELLVLSGALAELSWSEILKSRQNFRYRFYNVIKEIKHFYVSLFANISAIYSREIFMDFDPVAVSKINEKKFVAPGSSANSLLSEQKLRAVLENARQIIKVWNGCSVTI